MTCEVIEGDYMFNQNTQIDQAKEKGDMRVILIMTPHIYVLNYNPLIIEILIVACYGTQINLH